MNRHNVSLDEETVEILRQLGCDVDLDLASAEDFDYALDCGAFFIDNPRQQVYLATSEKLSARRAQVTCSENREKQV